MTEYSSADIAHFLPKSDQFQARDGLPVKTLCGITWSRPPRSLSMKLCPECAELAKAMGWER